MSRKEDQNLIVGLDIGTSKVVVVVGEISPDGTINVVGVGMQPLSATAVFMAKGYISKTETALQKELAVKAQTGGLVVTAGTAFIEGSTFYGNDASFDGGGILNVAGHVSVRNTTIVGNYASFIFAGQGAGLANRAAGTVDLRAQEIGRRAGQDGRDRRAVGLPHLGAPGRIHVVDPGLINPRAFGICGIDRGDQNRVGVTGRARIEQRRLRRVGFLL